MEGSEEVIGMLALRRWNPFKELSTLHQEMDELFRRTFGTNGGLTSSFLKETWYPTVESYMKEGNLVIHAELPGIDPKDVDISAVGDQLIIKGEKKASKEVKDEDYLFCEVGYGSFERIITLPEGVKTEKVNATYKNGTLEIMMPCEKAALPKRIPIELTGAEEKSKKAA
ncbi:MAG: Hsp20/alpha crystallin family protein [Deltaproteobacteria bacterium]|nr:Hsp20/alpha crystallin family protein [Deltaproteobacteria bacterium]